MLSADYLVIAQGVSVDDKNRVSIHGIIDQLHAPQVPVGLDEVTIAARIYNPDAPIVKKALKTKVSFKIKGKEITKAEISPEVTIEKNRSWGPIFKINNLVFPEFGLYNVELLVNDKKLLTTVFSVRDASELSEA